MSQATQSQFLVETETRIIVPYLNGTKTFISPAVGPGNYVSVGDEVRERELHIPTAEQTMTLVHAAYCGPENFRKFEPVRGVRETARRYWLAVPNVNVSVGKGVGPAEGVYVVADPQMKGRGLEVSVEELAEKIKEGDEIVRGVRASRDGAVRFAERDSYTLEWQRGKVADNGFVIASYGVEGAQQVAEVSRAIDKDVYVWGVSPGKGQIEKRVSALDEYDDRLNVGGGFDGVGDGYVFGVRA